MTRTAKCHCGALTISVDGDPEQIYMCHCELCQRRTGSSYNLGAWFPFSAAKITGEAREYIRKGDLGVEGTFYFCPVCGSNLYWRAEEMLPGMVGVAVGGFADPDFPAPDLSVYDDRRHRWLTVPEGVASFRKGPE